MGHDTFLLLDDAHLSPGMLGLVRGIEGLSAAGERPGFRALSLSATPDAAGASFRLDVPDDIELVHTYRATDAEGRALMRKKAQAQARRVEKVG